MTAPGPRVAGHSKVLGSRQQANEDLLGGVRSVGLVAEHATGQVVDRSLPLEHGRAEIVFVHDLVSSLNLERALLQVVVSQTRHSWTG